MYPDALLPLGDTAASLFPPGGAASLRPNQTAVFWLTLGPLPADLAAGKHPAASLAHTAGAREGEGSEGRGGGFGTSGTLQIRVTRVFAFRSKYGRMF